MKIVIVTLALVLCFYTKAAGQNPAPPCLTKTSLTKLFIVRHADKLPAGDGLSAAGTARAKELKRVLALAGIDSVFSTNFNRTKNTVQPLADLVGVSVKLYATESEVVTRILQGSRGKRLLVAGHSNTVANLIQNCGCTPPATINPIPDTQFDNLFLVLVQKVSVNGAETSKCELIRMKYGAVTN